MSLRDELFHGLVGGIVKESDSDAWQYNAIEAMLEDSSAFQRATAAIRAQED